MSRIVCLLTTLFLITITTTATVQIPWREVTDQEGRFSISFPERPQYQQIPNKTYGFTSESYSFFYQNHDLRISFVQLDPVPKTLGEAIKALNDSSASYTTGFGKLLRQDKLQDGGRQYENIYSDRGTLMRVRTRLYVRHGNLYTLSCTTDVSPGIDEDIARQFFSSFKFLEDLPSLHTPPSRRVKRKGAQRTNSQ